MKPRIYFKGGMWHCLGTRIGAATDALRYEGHGNDIDGAYLNWCDAVIGAPAGSAHWCPAI